MERHADLNPAKIEQARYVKPKTEKHEPVKIIQGSGDCNSLYYVALYALYT